MIKPIKFNIFLDGKKIHAIEEKDAKKAKKKMDDFFSKLF